MFKFKEQFNLGDFIISILIPVALGFIGMSLTAHSIEGYLSLNKPSFFLPLIFFPVVRTILYILMSIAFYIIWMQKEKGMVPLGVLFIYLAQLLFSFIWPFIFFSLNLYGLAFLELTVLILIVAITIIRFFKLNKISGVLMIPYIFWLFYEAFLNFYIWRVYEMFI